MHKIKINNTNMVEIPIENKEQGYYRVDVEFKGKTSVYVKADSEEQAEDFVNYCSVDYLVDAMQLWGTWELDSIGKAESTTPELEGMDADSFLEAN